MKLDKKEKIKKLFLLIQDEIVNNKNTIIYAIEKASKKLNLTKESTRNYYYKSLKYLRNNLNIAKEIGINLDNFKKKDFEKFNTKNKENLYDTVNKNLKRGISIRQSCLALANNDAKLMLRYQNKFRNMQKQKVKKEANKMQVETNKSKVINIIKAKQDLNRNITESEINALFMGLLKIVKKTAIESANEDLKQECKEATQNFRQTIVDLNKKEVELKKAYEINKELNLKIESQQQQICLLLERLSKRKVESLEKKSNKKYCKLKAFDKNAKNNNIL